VAERKFQMSGFEIAFYGVIPRQGFRKHRCNLVYFTRISAQTCTEIITEISCHEITQFQWPVGYSVIEAYEGRSLHVQVILM
jgi:hypothetical protein